MARLDLGFDRNEAGWPATPGIGGAMRRMDDAEAEHGAARGRRATETMRRSALEALGRALVRSLETGEIDERSLPPSVRELMPPTAMAMEEGEG